jgi:catechol 2,3-dioxygenase-like lactoylglutathione lyase family enzyme
MAGVKGVAHFSIPVSDINKSAAFYSDVVGCTLITSDGKKHAFLDAGGTCLLLCAETPPINKSDFTDNVHHAFIVDAERLKKAKEELVKYGVEIIKTEDRQGGSVNGPRLYFRDPDGTRLEFIDMTSYDTTPR